MNGTDIKLKLSWISLASKEIPVNDTIIPDETVFKVIKTNENVLSEDNEFKFLY